MDTSRFAPAPGTPRDGGVLYVGRILPHKGIDGVIRGLPEGVSLRIVGPPHHPGYLADLKRLAEGKPVTFHHDLNDGALIEEYRRALCVVLPSVYDDMYGHHSDVPELLGQTLLEGMACGAPGLCTDVASMPEIVTHGQTGFVVPPGNTDAMRDAIGALAADRALVNRLGAVRQTRTGSTGCVKFPPNGNRASPKKCAQSLDEKHAFGGKTNTARNRHGIVVKPD